jgi:hypothetical protein
VRECHRGDSLKKSALALLATVLFASRAQADARAEAQARQALTQARSQHAAHHYDRALTILAAAEKRCEPDLCSATLLAQLLRDMGTMQILDGDEEKGRSNFAAALSFDASIDLNPAYAVNDIRTIWNDVKSPGSATMQQPSGDFDHTPAPEQKKDVPLPVYVEYHGSTHPASVVVRYQGPGMTSFKRLKLVRVGQGWGAVIPCGASAVGTLRYYFQGFDGDDLPVLDGGDKRHPYTVPIRESIQGHLPHLPGHRAPTMCGEGLEETTTPSREAVSNEIPTTPDHRGFARIWIGVSAAEDFTVLPAGNDVCSRTATGQNAGAPSDPNWACTGDTPEGVDFPTQIENPTLVPGKAGNVTSGLQPANVRVKVSIDYAVTQNLLVGAAVGYVAGAYQGNVQVHFPPVHLEVRGTWVFGAEPLSHAGFAPFLLVAGGLAEYDANLTILVSQSTFVGQRPVDAWHVGGPGFIAVGGGARYAFSPRAAFCLGARATIGFGTSTFPAFGPELTFQVGL